MKTLQIRNVPDDLSRELKARAAAEGRSLSDYLLRELSRIAERPTRRQVLERIETRGRVELPPLVDLVWTQRQERP